MRKAILIFACLASTFYMYGQCPAGQTEITIDIFPISFGAEIGWELVDQTTGTVIACRPAGTYATEPGPVTEGPFCVPDGNTIVFTGYDSFGDDWNGGFFNVTVTEDGSVNGCSAQDGCLVLANGGEDLDVEPDVSITNSCETSNEEFVITLPLFGCNASEIMGCTDPFSLNFDMCATVDDGSCIPCDPLAVDAGEDGLICPEESFELTATLGTVIPEEFIDYTVTTGAAGSCTAIPDNPADCVDLGLGDDVGSGPIPLGFNFDFFGTSYSSVCVSSNGYVTFACVDETDFSEDVIPDSNDPNAIIALFWDDLNPTDAASGIVCTFASTINGQSCFVVDYQGITHFGGGETVTGQIIICPDNSVTINCIDCQSDGGTDSAGQGIEDELGATGAFDPAFPDGTIPGAASTSNCVTFTPNSIPDSTCDFVAWVTDPMDIAGSTVSTSNPATVSPTEETTYYAVVDCDGATCIDAVTVAIDTAPPCPVEAEPIPTMGEWGLICLSLLFLIFGIVTIKETRPVILARK